MSHPSENPSHQDAIESMPTWCDIDRSALVANLRTLRDRLADSGTARLGVVVKADAYGHGLAACVPAIARHADWLIVNSAKEATAVRAVLSDNDSDDDMPLYICGPLLPFEAPAVIAARARCVVANLDLARALSAAAQAHSTTVPVHLKVETDTHRQGVSVADVVAFADAVRSLAGLVVEGITTHYADIEDTTDHRFADRQTMLLREARDALRVHGHDVLCHGANSAATLLDARTHGDLVRTGIASYGLWPSRETQAAWLDRRLREVRTQPPHPVDDKDTLPTLTPVLSWRARLVQIKTIEAGAYVGYGRTYRATHASRIAIIPVGYHEGYDRRLSNTGHVLVHGVRCPVRGRVCMNMTMVDVTDVPNAAVGDTATLIGTDGDERISAEQLASWMGTIHYEVTSRIHPVIPRVAV